MLIFQGVSALSPGGMLQETVLNNTSTPPTLKTNQSKVHEGTLRYPILKYDQLGFTAPANENHMLDWTIYGHKHVSMKMAYDR